MSLCQTCRFCKSTVAGFAFCRGTVRTEVVGIRNVCPRYQPKLLLPGFKCYVCGNPITGRHYISSYGKYFCSKRCIYQFNKNVKGHLRWWDAGHR